MTNLHSHATPRMTTALVDAGAFKEKPFTFVDVGAREGVTPYWRVFGDDLRIVGFELDAEECTRMNAIDPRTRYLPLALDGKAGKRKVYVTEYSAATSFSEHWWPPPACSRSSASTTVRQSSSSPTRTSSRRWFQSTLFSICSCRK